MAITIGTPVQRDDGWLQASVSQSAAGTADVILAAVATEGVYVKKLSGQMSAGGTFSLLSDAVELTGVQTVIAGKVEVEDLFVPINTALKITTGTGAFKGVIVYKRRAKIVLA